MVVTGIPDSDGRKVEVIDLDNLSKTCIMSSDFPYDLDGAVGGFTSSGPIVCGGWIRPNPRPTPKRRSRDCYILRRGQFVKIDDLTMNTQRNDASSIVTADGNLMIFGGYYYDYGDDRAVVLSDTKIINVSESKIEDGFELPSGIKNHCSVLINATTAMVLGGYKGSTFSHQHSRDTKSTYFINLETSQVTNGPDMQDTRSKFGCEVFEHNNQRFVVAIGGYVPGGDFTEFLNLDAAILNWSRGKTYF